MYPNWRPLSLYLKHPIKQQIQTNPNRSDQTTNKIVQAQAAIAHLLSQQLIDLEATLITSFTLSCTPLARHSQLKHTLIHRSSLTWRPVVAKSGRSCSDAGSGCTLSLGCGRALCCPYWTGSCHRYVEEYEYCRHRGEQF